MNPFSQKRIGMKTLQLVALFLSYLVVFIPFVQAQPTYAPDGQPSQPPPQQPSASDDVSDDVSDDASDAAEDNEPEAVPTPPTAPSTADDAEGAGGEFSEQRGAYGVLLNLVLPQKTNKRSLTVQGTTNPHTRVRAYVNPTMPITDATSYHALTIADGKGAFVLTFTLNEGSHHLVVVAEGRADVPAGGGETAAQKATKEFNVTVDTTPPTVSLEQKISIVEGAVALKGTASENVVATVALGETVSEHQLQAGPFDVRVPVSESVARRVGQKIDVRITFTDEAGNTKQETKTMQILGPAPQLFSHNLNELSPTYTQKVTVRGNATPGAVVFVTVNDEVTPSGAWSTSILDLIKSLPIRSAREKAYTATAGPDGRFSIDVLLTQYAQTNFTQYLPQQPLREDVRSFGRQYDVGSTFENRLQIYVVDELGRSATSGQVSVVFAKCGSGGFWEIEQTKITPSTVIPEHLRRGLAQLGFNVKLKWRGPSDRATILSPPRFRVLQQSPDARRQYTFDPQTVVRQPIQSTWSDDYTVGGIVVNFNELPHIQKNLSDISAKKDLLIKIPLQMEILFEYEDTSGIGYTGAPGTTPAGVPPGTQYVGSSLGGYYQRPVPSAQAYGASSGVYGAQAGKITRTQLHCTDVVTVLDLELDERWLPTWLLKDSIEFFDDAITTLNQILQYLKYILIGTFVTCLGSFAAYYYKLVVEKLDCTGVYSGDPDSPEKQLCMTSKQSRKDYERYMKWICDRVYCPAAPTLAVHLLQANNAKTRALQNEPNGDKGFDLGSTLADAKESQCGADGMTEQAVYDAAGELMTTSSSFLTPFSETPLAPGASPAKQCAQEYLSQWDSACWFTNELRQSACIYDTATKSPRAAQTCGGPVGAAVEAASTICQEEVRPVSGSVRYGGTLPARDGTIEVTEAINGQPTKNKKKITIRDRWFKYLESGDWEIGTFYADRKEVKNDRGEVVGYSPGLEQFVPEYPQKILTRQEAEQYGLVPKVNRDYVVDPTSGIINSVRCMCLPAINTYVALIQRIFMQFRQCFQSILLTGEGSTGMCRRAFSETLCDFLIEAVKCFAQRYGAGSGGARAGRLEGISGFFKAVAGAGDHMHTTISQRYGQSNLYQMLNERSLIHSACFYAFTGDFDIDIEGALTGIGSVPVASEGFLYPKQTRRFMTSSPVTGNARFIYHIAGGIVAGSEIMYGAELICTASPTDCKQIYGFAGNKCDCNDLGEKRYAVTNFMGTGVMAPGEYVDMDAYIPVELPYRFDRVRLYWQWRNNQGNFQTEEKIMEIQNIGDEPPLTCQAKMTGFQCEIAVGQQGRAAFLKRPRPVKSVFLVNEPIEVDVEVEKYSPSNRAGTINPNLAQALSLAGQNVPFFLMYQLRDQNGNVIPLERYAGTSTTLPGTSVQRAMAVRAIVEDGVARFTIPSIVLTKDMLTRGMYSGAAGYARTVAYTNPDFAEAAGNKLPLRSMPTIDVTYPSRENLAVGVLMFKTKDAAGRDAVCYGVQRASLSDDLSKLLEGSRNYQFEIVPGALPCTDAELSNSGLGTAVINRLRNNIYRFDTALGTINYHGLRVQPESGSLVLGKLYADGVVFLAQQQAAATQCDDITAQNPARWKLSMELRPCKTRFENDIPGPDTCTPGDVVARFGGKAQEFSGAEAIDISVACDEVAATGELPACPTSALVNSECRCVGTSTSSRCGIAQGLNYCDSSGSCLAYEACATTDKNNGLYVDPSNSQNICDCNGKLGGATDMECGFGNYCVPCPAPNVNQYACVPEAKVDGGSGKMVDYFVKNPARAAELCRQRPASVPPVPPGPRAPGTGAVTPSPGTTGPVVSGPFTPQVVTLGVYGSAELNPATACGPDDVCSFHARADTVPRPVRSTNQIDSVVIHITAGSGSAIDTYRGTFFKAADKGTHFIIDRDGSMIQIENEDITTYHAGCGRNDPSCAKPGVNDNAVGIDLANYGGDNDCPTCVDVHNQLNIIHGKAWTYSGAPRYWEPFSQPQMKALAKLVAEIMLRYSIPIDHIYFHSTSGRPSYLDGTSGYSCENFAPNKPEGVYGGHADPGPLFDWCTFKEAVLRGVDQYAAAGPVLSSGASPDDEGIQHAGNFVDRLNQVCPVIDESCINSNSDFVVTQYRQYHRLCQNDNACEAAFFSRVDDLLGVDVGELLDDLDLGSTPPASPPPTANDGIQLAKNFANDIELMCLNGITIQCLNLHKDDVAAKVSAYAAQCKNIPECDNAFTRTMYTELGSGVAERVGEIHEEVASGAGV